MKKKHIYINYIQVFKGKAETKIKLKNYFFLLYIYIFLSLNRSYDALFKINVSLAT